MTQNRSWKRVSITLVLGSLSLGSPPAHAEGPSPTTLAAPAPPPQDSENERLELMEKRLALFASRARAQRHATIVTGLATAAALVPAGYVIAQRSDPVSQSIGVGMEIGGAAPLVFSVLSLRASGMERQYERFQEARDSGMPPADLLRLTEAQWQQTASAAHDLRIAMGVAWLVLGTASAGTGLFFLLNDPAAGMNRNQQDTVGSSLVGPGVPVAMLGIRMLLQESVEETSWEAYHTTMTSPPGSMGSAATERNAKAATGLALSVAPLRSGGVAAVSLAF